MAATDTFVTNPTSTEVIAAQAAAAAPLVAASEPRVRAGALVAAADAIDAQAEELIGLAIEETGLTRARLTGEVARTSNQLRLMAEVIIEGSYLDARIDQPDPDYRFGPRPDVRRVREPLGPVLNFAASNFPFAFSVAGGDTAAALAAGNPVVVKAHDGHPSLSERTAQVVQQALTAAGLPEHTLQLVHDRDQAVELLRDERIKAAAFTGSTGAGTYLAGIAAEREHPIPFFGELGSVNPVYLTPASATPETLAGFVTSVSGSAGQLCTKPGFLFVPSDTDLAPVVEAAASVEEHRLLYPGIGRSLAERRATITALDGVEVLVEGQVRVDDADQHFVGPTVVVTDMATLEAAGDALLDETFGPFSVVVRYDDLADLAPVQRRYFPGNLTSTVHATKDETEQVRELVQAMAQTSGRVLFGGWPTGVCVTNAMQHGGPFPATTSDATSVGTAAIERFLRAVAYQDVPEALLPPPLRDDNPWQVPQRRAEAGLSDGFGSLAGRY